MLLSGDTEKVFSSGTRLYVAESNQIKEPKVSAYLTTKQDNEKNILLCQARNMFPDMVKITWEAEDQNKNTVKVPGTDDELLEQRDEGQEVSVTSMLIINHQKAKYSKFNCIVQHDSSVNKDQRFTIERGEEKPDVTPVPGLVQTCPPPKVKQEGEGEDQQGGDDQVEGEGPDEKLNWGSPGLSRSLYLFRLTYVVLLVKNVLYFCSVSVLLYKRRAWNKEIHMSKT
ncbi:uncharacterized protein LOC113589822 [Electrophorus electricus]|uniref:uncharacterized protein LOC113589822 n=1 Tax=Electrophorus electricus TaxID=8005 RepID=UPI0015D09EAC|nr:uncharacterized protein LOC113589822 [Electrophorus electricus]